MKTFWLGQTAASLICLCLGATAATPASAQTTVHEVMSYDGLEKTSVKGIDVAYVRPGATLAGYTKLIIEPVQVTFAKSWNPKVTGSPFSLNESQREAIRTSAAKVFHDAFAKELQGGGYAIVSESGPDVLGIKPYIINLYVTAPDVKSAGRSRVYVRSAGQATLVAELTDSQTGQVIARVMDTRDAPSNNVMMVSSGVMNRAEGERIANGWAKVMRTSLDKANGIGSR
jgi:hypothetical protein